MTINEAGLALIRTFEGCKLNAYQDVVGIWTIGYGHTGHEVVKGMTITQDQAEYLLEHDLNTTERGVSKLVETGEATENQISALICFAYNVGLHNLATSTLLMKVNNNDLSACEEFSKWCHAGGKIIHGLQLRREAERALFLKK